MSSQFQNNILMNSLNNNINSQSNFQIYEPDPMVSQINTTSQVLPVEDIIKSENKFNYSVASLGDIYKNIGRKEEKEDETFQGVTIENPLFYETEGKKNSNQEFSKSATNYRPKSGMSLSRGKTQNSLHVNNVYLSSSPGLTQREKFLLENDPAKKQRKVEIKCLHKTKLQPSKKYSHVVNGVINPPQSTFSVKEVVDKNIQNHINGLKPYVLYPSRVKIENEEPEIRKYQPPIQPQQSQEKYNTNTNSMMVIGKGFNPKKGDLDGHVKFRPAKENTYERKCISSRKARKALNVSEKFVGAVDDYFYASEMKIPARNQIGDVVKYAKEVEKTLNSFQDELGTSKNQKTKFEDPFRKSLKEKKGLIKPKPPKVYPEIDETYKKNVKEKLSTLQIELRQIFDNITQIREHDPRNSKLGEMIVKAQELTKLIEHLAIDVQKSREKFNESQKKKKQQLQSQPINKKTNINYVNNSYNYREKKQIENVNKSITLNNTQKILKSTGFNPIMEEEKENNSLYQSNSTLKASCTKVNPIDSDAFEITNPKFQPQSVISIIIENNIILELIPKKTKVLYNFNPSLTVSQKKTFSISELQFMPSQIQYFIQGVKRVPNQNMPPPKNGTGTQNDDFLDINLTKSFGPNVTNASNIYSSTLNQNPSTTCRTINPNNTFQTNNYGKSSYAQTINQSQILTQDIPNVFEKTNSSLIQPQNSQILSNSNIVSQSQVVNDLSSTINRFPISSPEQIKMDSKNNIILDDRFSAFNVEFPVKYYYEVSKENEPPMHKDWYIRPHHTETFSNSKYAIPDDVLNTKYISYYGPPEKPQEEKTRQEMIEELIEETRAHREKLQYEMFQKANNDRAKERLYKELERAKEEALKTYKPGMIIDADKNKKSIVGMLNAQDNTSYSEMFNNNEDVHQTNLTISVYSKMLEELRQKEKELLIEKRKQEYERIRPPVKKWFELKGEEFQTEMQRNKMVINAKPEYFEKIKQLQNTDLY